MTINTKFLPLISRGTFLYRALLLTAAGLAAQVWASSTPLTPLVGAAVSSPPIQVGATVHDVTKYGAKGDKQAKDTIAIQAAIDACGQKGGGTVYFPPGNYLCGAIRLRDNIRLHLDAGVVLWASRQPEDYGQGKRCLLAAEGAAGISIYGPGTIHGIGEADLGRREDKSDAAMPAFRAGVLQFIDCRDVIIRDLAIIYSDTWTLTLRDCENVLIDGVTIRNNYFHTNSDGIDPVSCRNVRIANCHIVAGDDCIVMKTANGKPCENVVVTNCTLESIATAVKLGTESSGDFRNIHVSNCSIRNSTVGIGLYMKDGGTMERITFSGLDIETPTARGTTNLERQIFPIFVDIEKRHPDSKIGQIRDLVFENIQIYSGAGALIQGMPDSPIENVTLRNLTVRIPAPLDYATRRKHIGGRRTTSDSRDTIFARQPAYVVAAHMRRLVVDQLQVFMSDEDFRRFERSAFAGNDVSDGIIRNVFRQPAVKESGIPAVALHGCVRTSVVD